MDELLADNVIRTALSYVEENNPYPNEELESLLRKMFSNSAYESTELAAFPGLLVNCQRFIDVGANVGRYVIEAAAHLYGAEIIAIEANPYLRPLLAALKIELERSGNTNRISIENCAISDSANDIELSINTSPTLSSILGSGPIKRIPRARVS